MQATTSAIKRPSIIFGNACTAKFPQTEGAPNVAAEKVWVNHH